MDYYSDPVVRALAGGCFAGVVVLVENYFLLRPRIARVTKECSQFMGKVVFLQSKVDQEKTERLHSQREVYDYIERAVSSAKSENASNIQMLERRVTSFESGVNKRIDDLADDVKDVREEVRTGFQTVISILGNNHENKPTGN